MNVKDVKKIIIPKDFKVGNYIIHLKHDLVGNIFTYSNNFCQFIGESDKLILNTNVGGVNAINNIKQLIAKAYNENLREDELSVEERSLLTLIEYGIDTTIKRRKILFIGYKYDYPDTIRNTLELCDLECKSLLLKKNIELYSPEITNIDNDFEPIFNMIKDTVDKSECESYLVDIPNLTLSTKYLNTKDVLKYLSTKNKKIILMHPDPINRLTAIFRKSCEKNAINRKYLIRCGQELITKQLLNSILH